jgi:hypothetical protein
MAATSDGSALRAARVVRVAQIQIGHFRQRAMQSRQAGCNEKRQAVVLKRADLHPVMARLRNAGITNTGKGQ